jgi:alpha-ketoglutarate-dependent taurine dioxygenase
MNEPLRSSDVMRGLATRVGARRPVTVTHESMVTTTPPQSGVTLPLTICPANDDVSLAGWMSASREMVRSWMLQYGALLFRGFRVDSPQAFAAVAQALSPDLETYLERAAPRREVHEKIYTSTEFPASECIPLHHEMSYADRWPLTIWFHCAQPAESGGCTPIVDDRLLLARLPERITRPFLDRQVMYVRNFGEGADLSWQEAFQTADRAEVERYCGAHGITVEWRSHDRLRTRQVRQVIVKHPATGDAIWFNHAHMFHVSNHRPDVRAALSSEFADDELPRNAFYGDGQPIEDAVLAEIRALYDASAVRFTWQRGDVLLLDNILVSHGRDPFVGQRRILVAMSEVIGS